MDKLLESKRTAYLSWLCLLICAIAVLSMRVNFWPGVMFGMGLIGAVGFIFFMVLSCLLVGVERGQEEDKVWAGEMIKKAEIMIGMTPNKSLMGLLRIEGTDLSRVYVRTEYSRGKNYTVYTEDVHGNLGSAWGMLKEAFEGIEMEHPPMSCIVMFDAFTQKKLTTEQMEEVKEYILSVDFSDSLDENLRGALSLTFLTKGSIHMAMAMKLDLLHLQEKSLMNKTEIYAQFPAST